MKIESGIFSIWSTINKDQPEKLSKTFTGQKKNRIFSGLSTPRTLQLKTKKTSQYWNQLQQHFFTQNHDDSRQSEQHRKQKQILAQNHYRKRKELQNQLKDNVLQQIFKQSLNTEQSKIKLEESQKDDLEKRQQKAQNFIKRQQFKARQSFILKQMVQFLQFGAIRK